MSQSHMNGRARRLGPRLGCSRGRSSRWLERLVPPPEPQSILSHPTEAAIFLVLTVPSGSEADIADLLADVPGLKRSVGFRVPEAELTCVVGIGADLWDRLGVGPRPAGLSPFRELAAAGHKAGGPPRD